MVLSRSSAVAAAQKKAIEAKKITAKARQALMIKIYKECNKAKQKNNNKIPHGFFLLMFKRINMKRCAFSISLNAIKKGYKRYTDKLDVIVDSTGDNNGADGGVPLPIAIPNGTPEKERPKGGRPIGTTTKNKHNTERALIAARNKITEQYIEALEEARKGGSNKKLAPGIFKGIVTNIKEKRNLPDSFDVSYYMICKRVRKGNLCSNH